MPDHPEPRVEVVVERMRDLVRQYDQRSASADVCEQCFLNAVADLLDPEDDDGALDSVYIAE